jgi:hypothetical protein
LAEKQNEGGIFLEMWNLATGELSASVLISDPSDQSIRDWRISPDGRQLAIVEPAGIQIWNLDEGRHDSTVTGYDGKVTEVGFDSTGRYLRILVSPADDRGLAIIKDSKILTCNLLTDEFQVEVRPVPNDEYGGFHTQWDEDQGWRIHLQEPSMALVSNPDGRQVFSVTGLINHQVANEVGWGGREARFIRETELIEFSLARKGSPMPGWMGFFPFLGKLWQKGPWGEYRLMNRRTGAVVWRSNAKRGLFDELRRYRVSPSGERLAEMISKGEQTTVHFWTIPTRRWHRWLAGVLGVVAAGWTWWFGGRSRAVVSDSARDQV